MLMRMSRIILLLLSLMLNCAAVHAAALMIHVTDLYEVGQGNVALTTLLPSPLVGEGAGVRGDITNQYIYSPYGTHKNFNQPRFSSHRPLDIMQNQFGYTGQASDPSTNLMMLGGFRNYAPGIGRFIQPDTYNSFAQHAINNPNSYVKGNPVALTDPSGHMSELGSVLLNIGLTVGMTMTGMIGERMAMGALTADSVSVWGVVPAVLSITSSLAPLIPGKGATIAGQAFMGASLAVGFLGSAYGLAQDIKVTGSSVWIRRSAFANILGMTSSAVGIYATVKHNQTAALIAQGLGYAAMIAGWGMLDYAKKVGEGNPRLNERTPLKKAATNFRTESSLATIRGINDSIALQMGGSDSDTSKSDRSAATSAAVTTINYRYYNGAIVTLGDYLRLRSLEETPEESDDDLPGKMTLATK